jgi:hypothetical protein
MLWRFPLAWLLLALPFVSAGVIGRVRPLRQLSARHHRISWAVGAVGLCTFLAGFIGLLWVGWAGLAVLLGGAISGLASSWPTRPDDDGDDWRRWANAPDDGPPRPPEHRIDWQEFERLRGQWERDPRVTF